jgi:MFS family permease
MVRTGRGVLIPLYGADALGLSVTQIGWISTFASAIDMLLFYPVGMIMDRWGRKYAIVPSFFVQGIGLALIPLTGGFISLAAVAGLIGFGNGLGSGTMLTLGADLAPADVRAEFLGMWRLIGDLGFTLGPSVAGMVAALLALPSAALVMGTSGVVASMIFLFLVPETARK